MASCSLSLIPINTIHGRTGRAQKGKWIKREKKEAKRRKENTIASQAAAGHFGVSKEDVNSPL